MADLAQRLDVTGRRIVVLAGPGDRRDEDLRAIADAVAGRFDHYICRRDDSLRDRGPDEVPKLQAAQLQSRGVPASAISIIPDEQEAIDAALNMGQPGDLLLVFADALIRSWKQITKFKSAASPASSCSGRRRGHTRCRAERGAGSSGIGGFMAGGPLRPSPQPRGRGGRAGRGRGPKETFTPALSRPSQWAPRAHAPASIPSRRTADGASAYNAGELAGQPMPGIIRDERGVWIAPETED